MRQVIGFLMGAFLGVIVLVIYLVDKRYSEDSGGPERKVRHDRGDAKCAVLVVDTGNGKPLRFELVSSPMTLGRAPDNDVSIPQTVPGWKTVSRHHAEFRYDDYLEQWAVRDLGSRNGVYVDGKRTGHNLLWPGARLSFGSVEGRFEID